MKRVLFNFSPRGKGSNSELLAEWIAGGIEKAGGPRPDIVRLTGPGCMEESLRQFEQCSLGIFLFPLYADNAPGIVLEFFARLEKELQQKALTPEVKSLGFVLHSGFPEAVHSETLPLWFERLCLRLRCLYLGTVICPGTEGIRHQSVKTREPRRLAFEKIGERLAADGTLDRDVIKRLMRFRRFSLPIRIVFGFLGLFGIPSMYVKPVLKRSGAYEKRFDRPYASQRQ